MAYSARWKKILDEVDDFSRNNFGVVWYRGQTSVKYQLDSGLFRLKVGTSADSYIELEQQMYTYYQSLGHMLTSEADTWAILYSMQHHGVKTRFLDWSESFAVALFFAVESGHKGKACVWMLNPEKLNEEAIDHGRIISPLKSNFFEIFGDVDARTRAIYPIKSNTRVAAQKGVFTVQGNSLLPLNKEFEDRLERIGALSCIELGPNVREDAQNFLQQNGINHFSLFPDLAGLSQYINATHIKPSWIT